MHVRACVRVCVRVYSLHTSCPLSVSKPIRWAFQCTGGDRLAPNESIWDCLGETGTLCVCVCVFPWKSAPAAYIDVLIVCMHVLRYTPLYVSDNNPPCECGYSETTLATEVYTVTPTSRLCTWLCCFRPVCVLLISVCIQLYYTLTDLHICLPYHLSTDSSQE